MRLGERKHRGLACGLLLWAELSGCREAPRTHVAWPEELPAVSYFLHSDGEQVRELRGPFISNGGAPPSFEFTEIEGLEGFLVGFDLEVLNAKFPRLPLDLDPNQLQLETAPETCEGGRFEQSAEGHFRTMPAAGLEPRVWHVAAEDTAWISTTAEPLLAGLRLKAPEDPSRCISPELDESYHPFGAREALLEGVETLGGQTIPTRLPVFPRNADVYFSQAVWLDRDNVAVIARNGIFWVERGQEINDRDGRYRALAVEIDAALAPDQFFLDLLARDPRPRPDGRQNLIFFAVNADVPGRPRISALAQTSLGADGFSRPEILWWGPKRLRALQFEDSGRGIIVGNEGIVMVLDPDPSEPPRELSFQNGVPWLVNLELTGDPARPHLVTTEQNSYFLGDIVSGDVEFIRPFDTLSGTPSLSAHFFEPRGPSILSSMYLGGLLIYEPGAGWSSARFAIPSRAGECASLADECGGAQPTGVAYGLRGNPAGWFIAAMSECEAVFLLDVKSKCARVLLSEGRTGGRTNENGFFRRLEVLEDRAVVAGDEGRLLEINLP